MQRGWVLTYDVGPTGRLDILLATLYPPAAMLQVATPFTVRSPYVCISDYEIYDFRLRSISYTTSTYSLGPTPCRRLSSGTRPRFVGAAWCRCWADIWDLTFGIWYFGSVVSTSPNTGKASVDKLQ